MPPDFFCSTSHDPDDLAQILTDYEGGGLAEGSEDNNSNNMEGAGADGSSNDSTSTRTTSTTTTTRRARVAGHLHYTRPQSDRYIHKIRSAKRDDEFYELNPSADPELRLEDRLVTIDPGVPENDDVTNPKYNTDW